MTSDSRQLSELLEKAGADDIIRDMIGFVAQRLMELDVDNRCGASHGERSEARTNSRNGYRDRDWDTRGGTVPRRLPKLRQGRSFPPFLESRRTTEKALAAVVQEAYVPGISTRSVDDLVQAMGLSGISKSQVSRLCAEIDERVRTFLHRPIEGDWPWNPSGKKMSTKVKQFFYGQAMGYPSDLTDAEWDLIRHHLQPSDRRGRSCLHPRKVIVDAIGTKRRVVTPAALHDPGNPRQPRRKSQHQLACGRKLIRFPAWPESLTS